MFGGFAAGGTVAPDTGKFAVHKQLETTKKQRVSLNME
jgi:hypothetical protein